MLAAFPNVQGRLIAAVRVLRRGDASCSTPNRRRATSSNALSVFSRAINVADLSESVAVISLARSARTDR